MNPELPAPKKDFRETKHILMSDFCNLIRENLLQKGVDINVVKISCVINAYWEAMFDWMKENNNQKLVIKNFGSFRFSRSESVYVPPELNNGGKYYEGNKRRFFFKFSRALGDLLKDEIDIDKVRAYFTKKYKRSFEPKISQLYKNSLNK